MAHAISLQFEGHPEADVEEAPSHPLCTPETYVEEAPSQIGCRLFSPVKWTGRSMGKGGVRDEGRAGKRENEHINQAEEPKRQDDNVAAFVGNGGTWQR